MATMPRQVLAAADEPFNGGLWSDVGDWLLYRGLVIVIICVVAFVLTRIVTLVARRRMRRIADARAEHAEQSLGSNLGAYQEALIGAVRWAINFCIVFMATLWVLFELSLPATALVPLASVVGAGLGFGAQQIVGDVLAGIFILSERQFGVGDVIRVGPLVGVGWVEGRVEEMTLRVTKLRTFDGDMVTIANGELRQSVNASRDWARVLVTVPLQRDVDLEAVTVRLNEVGAALGVGSRRPRRGDHPGAGRRSQPSGSAMEGRSRAAPSDRAGVARYGRAHGQQCQRVGGRRHRRLTRRRAGAATSDPSAGSGRAAGAWPA